MLHLIKEGEGSNELVESKRGKKYAALDSYQITESCESIIEKVKHKYENVPAISEQIEDLAMLWDEQDEADM